MDIDKVYCLRIAGILSFLFCTHLLFAQYEDFHTVKATISFNDILRSWDGFGVNYVQTAHTRDYKDFPQEYGGFSLLDEKEKQEIIELIFGEEGIKPGLVKMFLDPLHQYEMGGPYDHETTTRHMLDFFERGWSKTRSRGGNLQIITTLYGPPAYMTLQKELRGRDMDPRHQIDLAMYMIDWVKFLQEKGFPVRYLSFHNEGEDWRRWAVEGDYANFDHGHDYNLYWRPEEVADFLTFMPGLMKEKGLTGIGLTPGECSRFFQFYYNGYAQAILDNPDALKNLDLITSHNFYRVLPPGHRWFAGTSNVGTAMIRNLRPDMKAWVTSASWGNMDVEFIWQIWMNIYLAKINGYIPWACIQRPEHWVNKDPNPGTAIVVHEDGTYQLQRGYYLYKQIARAGQPGMGIAQVSCMDPEIQLIGFAQNGTENPDALVVIHVQNYVPGRTDAVEIQINGTDYLFSNQDPSYNKHRDPNEQYKYRNIQSQSIQTPEGYHLELSIPWQSLGIEPSDKTELEMQLKVLEGAYSHAGEIIWKTDQPFTLGRGNSSLPVIEEASEKPVIDGLEDISWKDKHLHSITQNNHPNTDPDLKASWKASFDQESFYLFISIRDKTNLQGRRVKINLEGTHYERFKVIRSVDNRETYRDLGTMEVEDHALNYTAPPRSVTTFIGIK